MLLPHRAHSYVHFLLAQKTNQKRAFCERIKRTLSSNQRTGRKFLARKATLHRKRGCRARNKTRVKAPRSTPVFARLRISGMRSSGTRLMLVLLLLVSQQVLAQSGGAWITRAPLPTARQEMPHVLLDGKIYVPGGIDAGRSGVAVVEVYDPVAGTWSTTAPMPAALHHTGAAAANGKLYALGRTVVTLLAGTMGRGCMRCAGMRRDGGAGCIRCGCRPGRAWWCRC